MENRRLKQFLQQIQSRIHEAESGDYDSNFTAIALEYLKERGITQQWEHCLCFKPNRVERLDAYTLEEAHEHLDLFVTITYQNEVPKNAPYPEIKVAAESGFAFLTTARKEGFPTFDPSEDCVILANSIKTNVNVINSIRICILTDGIYEGKGKLESELPKKILQIEAIPIQYEVNN
jgi:hypothetical protein